MEDLKIGTVKITYAKDGTIEEAVFNPTLRIPASEEVRKNLILLGQVKDPEVLRKSADMIMAGWFSKMNEIELSDRSEFQVQSHIVECVKMDNGKIKTISIDYEFKQIS